MHSMWYKKNLMSTKRPSRNIYFANIGMDLGSTEISPLPHVYLLSYELRIIKKKLAILLAYGLQLFCYFPTDVT